MTSSEQRGPPGERRVRALRVFSDGAARGNPGPAGAGAVLTLPSGEVVERLGLFLGRQTNNYAEYMGAILGLRRAQTLGAEEVELVADSQLLIRQLGGQYRVKSPTLRPLHQEAQQLLAHFRRHQLSHVPREENTEADGMSNRAIDEQLTGEPL
jgi:ribonuclease HI